MPTVSLIKGELNSATIDGERSYTATYRVVADSKSDQGLTVTQYPGIPSYGQYYVAGNDVDSGAFVTGYSAQRFGDDSDNHIVWIVTVTYETHQRSSTTTEEDAFPESPLDQPAEIWGSGVRFERQIHKEVTDATRTAPLGTGRLLVVPNTKERLDASKDDFRDTLYIRKNFASINLDTYRQYKNATNNAEFFGVAAGLWKMAFPTWRRLYSSGTPYFEVTFEFEYNEDGWDLTIPFYGEMMWNDDKQESVPAADNWGRPMQRIPLNDDGTYAGSFGGGPNADPHEETYAVYIRKDFSALGIPTSF